MKQIIILSSLLSVSIVNTWAQATAYDFTMNDCNGNTHHLYSDLDSGYVVVLEYFMLSCSPCIDAGNALEPMYEKLKATCSNKIKFYHFAFNNSYTCAQIKNWVNANGYSSIPIDSGATQVAYYGGMGMPTVAVAAGKTHKLLYTSVGFPSGDTTAIADSVRKFFGCLTTAIKTNADEPSVFAIHPSPASTYVTATLNTVSEGNLKLDLTTITGQLVINCVNEKIKQGEWNKVIALPKIANGFYLLKGEMNGKIFVRKISIQQP